MVPAVCCNFSNLATALKWSTGFERFFDNIIFSCLALLVRFFTLFPATAGQQ